MLHLKSDLIGKDLGDLLWDLMLMRSMSTIDQQILYHATKLSRVDGLSTTLKEDNLSEESQLTHEIDCKFIIFKIEKSFKALSYIK